MKKYYMYSIIALVLFFLGVSLLSSGKHHQNIKLGAALALSGDAVVWGEEEQNGIQLALEDIDREDIDVVFEDTHTTPLGTINAGKKLIEVDRVDAIIGPTWLDSFTGFAELPIERTVVAISPSASITSLHSEEKVYDHIFSTWYRSDNQTRELMKYTAQHAKNNNIAVFYMNDTFTKEVADVVINEAAQHNLNVVFDNISQISEKDYRTALLKAKQQNVSSIFFWFGGNEEAIPFLTQRKELGMNDIVLYTTEWIQGIVSDDTYADITTNIVYSTPHINEDFVDRYTARFGNEPTFSASNAYDTVMMLVKTIDTVGTVNKDIEMYLENTTFDTITFGEVSFDHIHGVNTGTFDIIHVM